MLSVSDSVAIGGPREQFDGSEHDQGGCGHRQEGAEYESDADRYPLSCYSVEMNDDADTGRDEEQRQVTEQSGGCTVERLGQASADQEGDEEQEHPENRSGYGDADRVDADFTNQLEDKECGYSVEEGIFVEDETWRQICEWGTKLGVNLSS